MPNSITYFGIRHHGPGCASSLCKALQALNPDCIIIEGPTGGEDLLSFVQVSEMQPPVAMLTYCTDEPQLSTFHPFALFSPEWQAIRYAQEAAVPVRFMDLPPAITLAIAKQKHEEEEVQLKIITEATENEEQYKNEVSEEATFEESELTENDESSPSSHDPLDWLAQAAGYNDGESWWNHMVEERGDGADLFEAINHAMAELRSNTPKRSAEYEEQEARREAHMRVEIKKAEKEFKRIAVVCGAWHVPALQEKVTLKADNDLLKGLPKLKTKTTWVPWTYGHLSSSSGYGAGVTAPGWYEYLWQVNENPTIYSGQRSVSWYVRIAHLLRKHDLDCSSAHLIEAARLADTLAAMRHRPAPSLNELNEAALSVICNGNEAPMKLIERELMVGDVIGTVPANVPTVPLQQDLHSQQKSLRLKPEAAEKEIDLDLRKENDLAKSHLLHRLNLLSIDWGEITKVGQRSKGTFHEYWRLSWQPQFEVDIIIASRYGHSVETAATALCKERAKSAENLAALTELMDKVLLANLPNAVNIVAHELQERSVASSDPIDLLNALPALANVYRYGNVRQTDVDQVVHLFDNILQRAVIALPLAVANINADAAESVRDTLLKTERAVTLRAGDEQTASWRQVLKHIAVAISCAPLLRGVSCRLLLDTNVYALDEAAQQLNLNLSSGADAMQAAQWLDGFLNRNATVLLHNDSLWALIDAWLSDLSDEHFVNILPLIRRTFSEFPTADRRDLGAKAKHERKSAPSSGAAASISEAILPEWDEERMQKVIASLSEFLGIPFSNQAKEEQ